MPEGEEFLFEGFDIIVDNAKFVYPTKIEQKPNFVYEELYAMPCLRNTKNGLTLIYMG